MSEAFVVIALVRSQTEWQFEGKVTQHGQALNLPKNV